MKEFKQSIVGTRFFVLKGQKLQYALRCIFLIGLLYNNPFDYLHAQNTKDEYLVYNRNIKFHDYIVMGSLFADNRRGLIDRNYVDIDYSDSLRNYISQLTYNNWITLLSDDSTDWAAALILNNIFGMNVHNKSIINDTSTWRDNWKKKEIKFWSKYLKKKRNFKKISSFMKSPDPLEDRFAKGLLQDE